MNICRRSWIRLGDVRVTFGKPVRRVVSELINNGVGHHASMVYGDFVRPMQILAKIKGWSIIGETDELGV